MVDDDADAESSTAGAGVWLYERKGGEGIKCALLLPVRLEPVRGCVGVIAWVV